LLKSTRKGGDDLVLPIKQEKFCVEYAKSGNARHAYKKAGYNCKTDEAADSAANRLLKKVEVKARLAELAEEAKNASIADIVEMQQRLTTIIRQELEEEVVVVESTGDFSSEARKINKKPAIKDVINAINTLGKMQGAFIEKVEIDADISPVVIKDDVHA
jgi:phage terminase small subunit